MRVFPIGASAALIAGLLVATPATAVAAPGPAAPADGTITVALPTGDPVRIRDAGGTTLVVADRAHPAVVQRVGREVYAIPPAYTTLVGSVVDRSLFDLTRLRGVAPADVPVTVTLPTAGATVPGVRLAAHGGRAARGVISDPAGFGSYLRALARQPVSAARLSVALAAGHAPAVSTVATARQVTVTIAATPPASGPAPRQVSVFVLNMDDSRRFADEVDLTRGPQQVRLPVGHYALLGDALQLLGAGGHQQAVFSYAVATDQDATADGQRFTVDLHAATGSLYPSFTGTSGLTPVATTEYLGLTDAHGLPAFVTSFPDQPGVRTLAAPSAGAQVGRVSSSSLEQFAASAEPSAAQYYYSNGHPNAIVPAERVAVRASAVATVRAQYYAGPGVDPLGYTGRTPVYPYLDPGVIEIFAATMPMARSEYLLGSAGVVWHGVVTQYYGRRGAAFLQDIQSFAPGRTTREDFWRGPIAAGLRSAPTTLPNLCTLCRTDQVLAVGLAPAADTDPAHGGQLVNAPGQPPAETRLRVYRGDSLLSDTVNGADAPGAYVQVPVGADAARYRIDESVSRAVDGVPLSTHSTSSWTFTSAGGSGGPIPAAWSCGASGTGACTLPDVLSVRVPLPTSLSGVLPAGDLSFVVTVGRAQGATPSAVTGLRFAISADGSTFTPQRVIPLSGGRFVVTIHDTAAAGTPMTVRWSAADAAGSTVLQTVQAAYLAG